MVLTDIYGVTLSKMNRLFLCGVILFLANPAQAQMNCAEVVGKPIYPILARQAIVQGEVNAHFDVGADGKPFNVVVEGNPLLKEPVQSAINATTLNIGCGTVELIYKFVVESEVKDPAQTSVVFKPPNEYVITTSHPLAYIDYGVVRRSWFKRFLHL